MRTSTTQIPLGLPLNRSHSLSRGLVGCWPMNEGGGLKTFDKVSNNNGALTNGAIFKQSVKGNCVFVDGVNDYIDNGNRLNSIFSGANAVFSASIWMRPNSASMVNNIFIASLDTSAGQRMFLMSINANSKPNMLWYGALDGSSYRQTTSSSTAITNIALWYHVIIIYDGTNATINSRVSMYVNGLPEVTTITASSGTPVSIPSGTGALSFGANSLGATAFSGLINNVMIYNRRLSATEAMQLYTNSYQMYIGKVR